MRNYLMIISCIILLFSSQVLAIEDIEQLKKSLNTTADKTEQGLIHKKIGDYYTSKEDYRTAAESYIASLSTIRANLDMDMRVQIAKYLSWGGRLKESINELNLILKEEPNNQPARILRARVLSWNGNLDEAIKEADKILQDDPGNKHALLIKATALRWQGKAKEAKPIYQQILTGGEDFDARLGLAYGTFSLKDIQAAKENDRLLKPIYPYQNKEMLLFREEFYELTAPQFDLGYSYYKDQDDNEVNRYYSGFSFWLGNFKNRLQYFNFAAKDDSGRENFAEDLSLSTYTNITDRIGVGGGIGLYQTNDGVSSNFGVWHVKTDVQILRGQIGLMVAHEGFSDTAELIEKDIRVTKTVFYLSQPVTDRLSFYTSYIYRDYSDSNNSHDLMFSPKYMILSNNPTLYLGYKFRYLDFNRQSRGGYFDPDNFLAHQIFAAANFKMGDFYGYLEPFLGYETYSRYGSKEHSTFGGGSGILGYKASKHFSFEITGEGGNYAGASSAGWNYYMFGAKLLVRL